MSNQIFIFALLLAVASVNAQPQKERVCSSSRHFDDCQQLQRGNSEVICVYAQDAIECAQRIRNGTADFGAFSAENTHHLAALAWTDLTVVKEIRHSERINENFDFQSVVVVRSNHRGGIDGLRGTDFCHPGLHYDGHQKWSEKFLKHFERSIMRPNCTFDGVSPTEAEVRTASEYFNSACHPGTWSHIPEEDAMLKEKYPKLCSLCENPSTCSYEESSTKSSHRKALECARKSANTVTYVALQEAQLYFNDNSDIANDFRFLCPNGTLQVITSNEQPCVWLTQPWKVIISNNAKSVELAKRIDNWFNSYGGNSGWQPSLQNILTDRQDYRVYPVRNIVRVPDYIFPLRPMSFATDICETEIKWCTHSEEELEKCEVVKMAAYSTGIIPPIMCNKPTQEVITCLSDVQKKKADFVGIDSNFGFLARNVYNLTTALYEETENEKYSSVVVLIKEKDTNDIKSFENFKGKSACFPEFGGIASIAFINTAKNRGIFKKEHCAFGQLLGEYFGDSCLPGSRSVFHDRNATNPDSLCNLCQTQYVTTTAQPIRPMADLVDGEEQPEIEQDDDKSENIPFVPNRSINCAANPTNRYYGTRGALSCLNEMGDIAVLELQKLAEHAQALKLDPDSFRILCRNGSLAANTGFDVDSGCLLTTIVDGEIVMRKNSDKNNGIVNALLSLDKYLQHDPDFKMYNIFNGEKNLLFEDSSLGLVSPNDAALSHSVKNYIQLFQDVESCMEEETGSAAAVAINILLTFSLVMFTVLIRN